MKQISYVENKVFSYIEDNQMLSPGDRVTAGVSGGADSVCLLFVLLKWAEKHPLQISVVHVNHQIRREAGEDEAFVRRLCLEQGIPFYSETVDVKEMAGRNKISEEEAGRMVRYAAFERIRKETGAGKIAVAHNMNDQAETMLFHLFRGSGLNGLGGIRPVRGIIIRPLLCLGRNEIEAYLQVRGISYCVDDTNFGDDYARNRIRHHILPYAEQEIAPGCIKNMSQTALMLKETEEYLALETEKARLGCVTETGTAIRVEAGDFLKLPAVIQKRLLYTMLKKFAMTEKNITYVHIENVLTLFTGATGRIIMLPYDIRCRRQYREVIFDKSNECGTDKVKFEPITIIKEALLQNEISCHLENYGEISLQVFNCQKSLHNIPFRRCTKWFDYDKINQSMQLRTRMGGDYFYFRSSPDGLMRHKKVKEYMITEKIPVTDRDQMILLTEGNHVIWVLGYRISEYYKISENTKRILQVQLKEGPVEA